MTATLLVELIDLYPTLSELAGLETPPHVQGKSLVPILKNRAATIRETAYSSYPARVKNKKYSAYHIKVPSKAVGTAMNADSPRLKRGARREELHLQDL